MRTAKNTTVEYEWSLNAGLMCGRESSSGLGQVKHLLGGLPATDTTFKHAISWATLAATGVRVVKSSSLIGGVVDLLTFSLTMLRPSRIKTVRFACLLLDSATMICDRFAGRTQEVSEGKI